MDWYKKVFLIGVLSVPVIVQCAVYIKDDKAVLMKPVTFIDAVHNPDLPSNDYYAPLHDFVDNGFYGVS